MLSFLIGLANQNARIDVDYPLATGKMVIIDVVELLFVFDPQ